MTTIAQVKKLVRPLLARFPDMTLVDRMIVITPITHVLRGIYIDRTGEARRFKPRWFVIHLFEPAEGPWFNFGEDIYGPGVWLWADQHNETRLLDRVSETVLPTLLPLDDIHLYVARMAADYMHALHLRPLQKVIVDAALGRLDDARAICRDKIQHFDLLTYGTDNSDKVGLRRAKDICEFLAADDLAGLAEQLHKWELYTVRALKIEHLWQRTPFPVEALIRRDATCPSSRPSPRRTWRR